MTLILSVATFAVLTTMGVACRRARLDLEEALCDCRRPAPAPVAASPVLTRLDGGRAARPVPGLHRRERHLHVVGAR